MRERMQRFNEYMIKKGLNDNQVETACGLAHGTLSQCRSGKSDLGAKSIDKIVSKYLDLSKSWLVSGVGDMLIQGNNNTSVGNNSINGSHNNDSSTIEVILRLTKMLEQERAEKEQLKRELDELRSGEK